VVRSRASALRSPLPSSSSVVGADLRDDDPLIDFTARSIDPSPTSMRLLPIRPRSRCELHSLRTFPPSPLHSRALQVVSNAAIPYGAAGVVVTCDKGKEKHAVRDVIRYMNESYETLVPSARQDERHDERKNKSEGDVSDALEAELRALKEEGGDGDGKVEGGDGDTERRPSRDRFKALKLDFRACAFIQARPRSITLVPIRPRSRRELHSLRKDFLLSRRISPPTHPSVSIPAIDAFQVHP
jgi:hypothetical protein